MRTSTRNRTNKSRREDVGDSCGWEQEEKTRSHHVYLTTSQVVASVLLAALWPHVLARYYRLKQQKSSFQFFAKSHRQKDSRIAGAMSPSLPLWIKSSIDFPSGSSDWSNRTIDDCGQSGVGDGDEDVIETSTPAPAGQHLMVSLSFYVKSEDTTTANLSFLSDADSLLTALRSSIPRRIVSAEGGGTASEWANSTNCHDLTDPLGVSCVLSLSTSSRAMLHTFPSAHKLLLDLFVAASGDTSCSSSSIDLVTWVPALEATARNFDKNATNSSVSMTMHWSHKRRGYRAAAEQEGKTADDEDDVSQWAAAASDSEHQVLGRPEHIQKHVLLQEITDFQTVELYETTDANKKVFLDGVLQSTLHGLEAYHEALVHPALVSHPHPQRVAIIGGGEGATLREVLKHNTVESVTMIDIDGDLIELARQALPEWHDCSDIIEGTGSCFDDPRTKLYTEDAIAWFMTRFGPTAAKNKTSNPQFDVVIMDALDPSSAVGFSDVLYGDESFVSSMVRSLTPQGILVLQTGEADAHGDYYNDMIYPKDEGLNGMFDRYNKMMQELGAVGMTTYAEGHGQFGGAWEFDLFFMGYESKRNFYLDPALIENILAQRAVATKSGQNPFLYFDGATMAGYQYPSRHVENVFCNSNPSLPLCSKPRGYDPDRPNVPARAMRVQASGIPNAGRGLFFQQPFDKGSYLSIDDSAHAMLVMPETYWTIQSMVDHQVASKLWKFFPPYLYGYGYSNEFYGDFAYAVDAGQCTFINHGCNSTYVTGVATTVSELTADPDNMPLNLLVDYANFEEEFANPVALRNHFTMMTVSTLLANVQEGDEATDNYLTYQNERTWAMSVRDLRAQCLQLGVGAITEYEYGRPTEAMNT